MTEPIQPAIPANHAAHDPTWIAALASRDPDLSPSERTRAEAVLGSCGACADLFADLVAVSAAIPSAAIPARPRDFTLTEADAARLRPGGLRRWVAAIGSVRDGITFPLAMGLTTMGIAGLLFATVPGALSSMSGATAAGPELSTVGAPVQGAGGGAPPASAAAAAPSAAASAAPAAEAASGAPAASRDAALGAASAAPMPAESVDKYLYSSEPDSEVTGEGGVFSGDGEDSAAQRQDAAEMAAQEAAIRDDASGVSALAVVAATLLLAGLGLFALRWTSRRLGDG